MNPTWISGLLLTQKLILALAQMAWVYWKENWVLMVEVDWGRMASRLAPTELRAKSCSASATAGEEAKAFWNW